MTTAHHNQRSRLGVDALERRDVPAGFVLSAAEPGAVALVRVLDGTTGATKLQIDAFPGYTGGLYADAGAHHNGDGFPDRIAVGTRGGTTPHVKVFDGATGALLQSFLAFDAGFRGGVDVALGDVNGDGIRGRAGRGRGEFEFQAGFGRKGLRRVEQSGKELLLADTERIHPAEPSAAGLFVQDVGRSGITMAGHVRNLRLDSVE